ncbi:MAG: carboxypeptidase regulatory-like domain-containing protein, partial [Propionibacteriaceae bacterium]|nr:carboxypeptidase regulatory-like domain-containing protein [Propionibacteriaceae bacterium]
MIRKLVSVAAGVLLVAALAVPVAAEAAPGIGLPAAKYTKPKQIHSVNATKTTVELTWQTVTGAPGYMVKAVGGGKTITQMMPSVSTYIFRGLKPGTKYTFTIAVASGTAGSSKGSVLSAYSSAKTTRSTNPSSYLDQPTDLKLVNVYAYDADLSWKAPAGFNPAKHRFLLQAAKNQSMSSGLVSQLVNTSANPGDTVTASLKKLSSNSDYFVRVSVVKKSSTKAVSDRTNYCTRSECPAIAVKTPYPRGALAGLVTVAPGFAPPFDRYIAAAYSSSTGSMVSSASVESDGTFLVKVPKGKYRVQILNVGGGNYINRWVAKGTSGVRYRSNATVYSVGVATAAKPSVQVATTQVSKGGTITGRIVDSKGKPIKNVTVAALNNHSTKAEVLDQDLTDSKGNYTLNGLSAGPIRIRAQYTGVGFHRATKDLSIKANQERKVNDMVLKDKAFVTTYKVWISKPVQASRTTCVANRAWLASKYPTSRATDIKYRWYLGKTLISNSKCVKLKSGWVGKQIKVVVTYARYGFITD